MSAYYAIVPASVRYDKRLIPSAKLLYGEITALCNEKGFCWATNQYFADLYEVSLVTISKWVNNLVNNGHIFSSLEVSPNGTERKISIVDEGVKEKFVGGLKKSLRGAQRKVKEGHKEKLMQNNTFNTTTNNTESAVLPFLSESFQKAWDEWLLYRKERRFAKYTETGLKKTFKDLAEISYSDEKTAIAIISQSLSKNWQGLFPLKNSTSPPPMLNKYEAERQEKLKNFKIIQE